MEPLPLPKSGHLAFLLELDRLKEVWRKNHVFGTSRSENDAEHSWHGAVLALALGPLLPEGVNAHRVSSLMLVHDMGEIDTGDVIVYGKDEAKAAIEERAGLERLLGLLPTSAQGEIRALWIEFEEGQTPEARTARAIDRMLPCMENIASNGRAWHENGISFEQAWGRNRVIGETFPELWAEIEPRLKAIFSR